MSLPPLPTFPRSAYINPPAELVSLRGLGPAQHGWGRGWPHDCPRAAQLGSPKVPRPSDGRDLGRPVRRELVPLFERLFRYAMELAPGWELRAAAETHGGQGGTVCRAIKGSNPPVASDHSFGKAWDVNSKGNPMRVGANGAAVNFVSRQPPVLIELSTAALLYWGGWYWDFRHRTTNNRYYVDSMHLEFVGRVSDVPRAIAQLDAKYQELRPSSSPVTPEEPQVDRDEVRQLQELLNDLGADLVVDGLFGPLSRAALAKAKEQTPELMASVAASRADANTARRRLRNADADLARIEARGE